VHQASDRALPAGRIDETGKAKRFAVCVVRKLAAPAVLTENGEISLAGLAKGRLQIASVNKPKLLFGTPEVIGRHRIADTMNDRT
jgi:hypothetical protein